MESFKLGVFLRKFRIFLCFMFVKKILNVSVCDCYFFFVVKGLFLGVINGFKLKYEINDFVLDFRFCLFLFLYICCF